MPIEMPSQPGELLAIQGRAVSRRQGAEAGMNPRAMRTQVTSGRWQRLQRGVYAAFSGEPARETMLWAALLRAGPGAVLSHQTAAERHGLIDGLSSLITITVPAARHPARVKIPAVVMGMSPPYCAYEAGRAPPTLAPAPDAASRLHDRGQFWSLFGPNCP